MSPRPEVEIMHTERSSTAEAAARAAAFRRLAEQHLEAGYRLAYAILGNPAEAQDATHDAFVQAWRKWSTLRDPEAFVAWFDRIVVNTCRNRLRHSSRWRSQDLSDDITPAMGDPMGQALDREVIRAALADLSPDHQVVVALRYYRDLSVDQIARHLRIPPGTVKSRLHYATQRLHAALEAADEGEANR